MAAPTLTHAGRDGFLMRAAWIEAAGGPETLVVGERRAPEAGPGQVSVAARAAGVAPWEVKAMAGLYGPLTLPYVVGFEFSGIIDQLGEGVEGINVGDSVYGTDRLAGSFAELRVADRDAVALKPETLSHVEAAALAAGGAVALEGLVERLHVTAGENILITRASGGVGTVAVQIAQNTGARVFAVAGSDDLNFVRSLGADDVFDYRDPLWPEHVRAASGRGVDALFDIAGGETLGRAFEAVVDGGRAIGVVWGGPDDGPRGISFERFVAGSGAARLLQLAQMVDAGRLRVEIAAEFPLDRAREALERVAAGHTRGKVVLRLN